MTIKQALLKSLLVFGMIATLLAVVPKWIVYADDPVPRSGDTYQPPNGGIIYVKSPIKIDKTFPSTGGTNNSSTVIHPARSQRR